MRNNNIKKISKINKLFRTKVLNRPPELVGSNIIFTYHGLSINPKKNCVEQNIFLSQVEWIKDNYTVVSLSNLVDNHLSCENTLENFAAITFDDGYVNFLELAVPILEEFNCKATLFVPSGKVGQYNDWDLGRPDFRKMPIMNFSQIQSLPDDLVDIGSHGISHQPLTLLSPAEVEDEITNSKKNLEEKTGRNVDFFSFPYGIFPRTQNITWSKPLSQYKGACTSRWGRSNHCDNRFSLKRVSISELDSMDDFYDKAYGFYDWLEHKERIGALVKKLTCG